MKKLFVAGLAIGLGCAGTVDPVVAASLDVNFTPGTVLEVSQVTDYMVLSNMMLGISVTANLTTGQKILPWRVLSTDADGKITKMGVEDTVNNWSLYQLDQDTYEGLWYLESTGASISSVVIDAVEGNIVFDTMPYPAVNTTSSENFAPTTQDPSGIGTTGSGLGDTFAIQGVNSYDIVATYKDAVRLPLTVSPSGAVGDLYRYLTIDFGTNYFVGSTTAKTTLTFLADTDKVGSPVPEPATLFLFATGLAGLAAVGRRRRN